MDMKRGKVVVTGAAGRVGRLICGGLGALGWNVVATDLVPGEGLIVADCLDVDAMRSVCEGAHGVIHLAGQPDASHGWRALRQANIDGTQVMLDAARHVGLRRFVFASSIHVIGAWPVSTPFVEGLELRPSGLYGASKIAAEALVSAYALKTGLSCVNVRICTLTPRPRNARELKTWLSPDDAVHLFDRCLVAPFEGCRTVWGISANKRAGRIDPVADAMGYEPRHDAEAFAPELAGAGIDISGLGEWARLGGRQFDEDDLGPALW